MNEPTNIENEQDLAKRIDNPEAIESNAEEKESDVMYGAELLENPPNGNFTSALKAFSEWFKGLFAK